MKLVIIEWHDSRTAENGWQYLRERHDISAVMCQTVGWIIDKSDDALLVAQSLADINSKDSQSMGRTVIAICQVKLIRDLEDGNVIWASSDETSCQGLVSALTLQAA